VLFVKSCHFGGIYFGTERLVAFVLARNYSALSIFIYEIVFVYKICESNAAATLFHGYLAAFRISITIARLNETVSRTLLGEFSSEKIPRESRARVKATTNYFAAREVSDLSYDNRIASEKFQLRKGPPDGQTRRRGCAPAIAASLCKTQRCKSHSCGTHLCKDTLGNSEF